jgi:hypothetical protein
MASRYGMAGRWGNAPAPAPTGREIALGVVGLAVLLLAAFYGGGGWYFSGVLADSALDAAARRAASASYSYTVDYQASQR